MTRGVRGQLVAALEADGDFQTQLALVLGAVRRWREFLVRHPEQFLILVDHDLMDTRRLRSSSATSSLRPSPVHRATKRHGSRARQHCVSPTDGDCSRSRRGPVGHSSFSEVTHELAHLADAVLAACLELAHCGNCPRTPPLVGSRSSRWASAVGRSSTTFPDVDVIFVAEPAGIAERELVDEAEALKTATLLARGVMRAANDATPEGAIWEIDAAPRPEGKSGALVRTLASHVGYHERWAPDMGVPGAAQARASRLATPPSWA